MADYNRLVFNMSQIDEEESLAIFTPSTLGANSPQCVSSQTPNIGTPVRSFATPGSENAVASGSALATDSPYSCNSPKKASETPRSIACPAKKSRRPLIMMDPNMEQTMLDDSDYTNSFINKMSPANKQSFDSKVSLLTPILDTENASVSQVISDSTPNTQAMNAEECENLKFTPAKEFFKLQSSLQIMTPDAYDTPPLGTVPITDENEVISIASNSQSFEKNDRLNFTTANQSFNSNTSHQLLTLNTENATLTNPNVTSMSQDTQMSNVALIRERNDSMNFTIHIDSFNKKDLSQILTPNTDSNVPNITQNATESTPDMHRPDVMQISTGSGNQNFEDKLQALEDHYKEQQFVLLEQVAQAEHKFEEKCAEVTKLTEMLSAATAQTQELSNSLAAAEEEKLMKQVSATMDETGRINLEMSTILEENTRNLEEHYKEQNTMLLEQVLQAEKKYDELKSEKDALESKLRESEENVKQQNTMFLEQVSILLRKYHLDTKDKAPSQSTILAEAFCRGCCAAMAALEWIRGEAPAIAVFGLPAEAVPTYPTRGGMEHLVWVLQAEKKYDELKSEKDALESNLRESEENVKQQHTMFLEQVLQAEKKYDEVKSEKDALESNLRESEENVKQQHTMFLEQVLQAEKKYDELKSEKDALESNLRESEENVKQQHTMFLEQVLQAEKKYDELKSEKDALESNLRESEENVKQQHTMFLEQVLQAEKKYDELKSEKDALESNLRESEENVKQQHTMFLEQVLQAEKKYDELKSEKDALESNLRESEENVKQQHTMFLEQVLQAEKKYDELKSEKDVTDKKLQQIEERMNAESEEFDQIENNLRTENFELKREVVLCKFKLKLITEEEACVELGCDVAGLS
ncbi:hypothetical protein Ddc_07213 [Ditylenchus destructor]|nr:hypothetical protein Ddc_07213 [Ditylenchus destructor]